VAKARKGKASAPAPLRVSRSTLARVKAGRVISNHRPMEDTQRKIELLMAAVRVLQFDAGAKLPEGVPDTYEKLYDRAVGQFLDLYDAEPEFSLPAVTGPTAKRRSVWIRGDYMIRIEKISATYSCPVSRLIDAAIDTYVDYYTRGVDPKLITALTGTARKILSASEATGEVLRKRERKARKLMRTGRV
jgi:hypothetical protein